MSLKKPLNRVDTLVDTGEELIEGASEAQIEGLRNAVLCRSGQTVPNEVLVWFRWHNGQSRDSGLSFDDGRLLSIDESLAAWDFFLDSNNEFLEPYEESWLPIQSNDHSDYLVYDLRTGHLISYWHDDERRNVEYQSLEELSLRLESTVNNSKRKETWVQNQEPQTIKLSIYPEDGSKNLSLAREIHSVSGIPLMAVVKMLSNGQPSSLSWNLADTVNSMEQSRQVRLVQEIGSKMIEEGMSPIVVVESEGKIETIELADLEALSLRCLTT